MEQSRFAHINLLSTRFQNFEATSAGHQNPWEIAQKSRKSCRSPFPSSFWWIRPRVWPQHRPGRVREKTRKSIEFQDGVRVGKRENFFLHEMTSEKVWCLQIRARKALGGSSFALRYHFDLFSPWNRPTIWATYLSDVNTAYVVNLNLPIVSLTGGGHPTGDVSRFICSLYHGRDDYREFDRSILRLGKLYGKMWDVSLRDDFSC